MARETGDLWPQSSGSASLGAEMSNGGFTGAIRPFAHVHMYSGIFHNSLVNSSGIIRLDIGKGLFNALAPSFSFSFNGGTNFPLEIGGDFSQPVSENAYIETPRGDLRLATSGILTFLSLNSNIGVIANNGDVVIQAAGNEIHNIDGVYSEFIDNSRSSSALSTIFNTIDDFSILTSKGFISLQTLTGDIVLNSAGSATLQAFSNSGVLLYQFGPYQSWYMKTSHASTGGPFNDGYWPIAHSGNVSQMINQAVLGLSSGLQVAYNGGRRIITNSTIGDLEFVSDTAKTKFAGTTRASLNMSGVLTRPSTSLEIGDMWMYDNSAIEALGNNTNASSRAESTAKALGLATLCYNTGSGVINVSNGSGIVQYFNTGTMQVTLVAQVIPFNTDFPISDRNYGLGTGSASGQVTIFSPGLYRAAYKILLNKTVGTTPQTCTISARQNGSNLLGSATSTFHFDNTTAAQNAGSAVVLFNANAGDTFDITVLSSLDGANNVTLGVRGALVQIDKIGPKRGRF